MTQQINIRIILIVHTHKYTGITRGARGLQDIENHHQTLIICLLFPLKGYKQHYRIQ